MKKQILLYSHTWGKGVFSCNWFYILTNSFKDICYKITFHPENCTPIGIFTAQIGQRSAHRNSLYAPSCQWKQVSSQVIFRLVADYSHKTISTALVFKMVYRRDIVEHNGKINNENCCYKWKWRPGDLNLFLGCVLPRHFGQSHAWSLDVGDLFKSTVSKGGHLH